MRNDFYLTFGLMFVQSRALKRLADHSGFRDVESVDDMDSNELDDCLCGEAPDHNHFSPLREIILCDQHILVFSGHSFLKRSDYVDSPRYKWP